MGSIGCFVLMVAVSKIGQSISLVKRDQFWRGLHEPGDSHSGLLASLNQGGTSCIHVNMRLEKPLPRRPVPSTETFLPSSILLANVRGPMARNPNTTHQLLAPPRLDDGRSSRMSARRWRSACPSAKPNEPESVGASCRLDGVEKELSGGRMRDALQRG